ncbi:hypothetical protein DSAG12_03768 [Promethearchaeum syntrophicum]|uniref:Uncharacterized protein n=1 Tax=Promethearchaeum syntrophicum TaxID=2594042 RepID=A0A5B9DGQ4_9ARCH|nr:hypothetical protein [Candidatus Prometheoarchaeum syntrophicum]QEE17930.1 hypothetical protein DSAG12_03768 [Candidatus Prometheoarchaeum syntrophicum]
MERTKILSKEELDLLKQQSQKKKILKWVFFWLGIIIFVISILFFIFELTIDSFVIEMTYDNEVRPLNLSVFFGALLLTFSMILISQILMNTNNYNENSFHLPKWGSKRESLLFKSKEKKLLKEIDMVKFRSFAKSRFIAAILMIGMATINISVFGTDIDTENHIGSWFFLGGPSMFFPMSAFMLLVGIGLLIYSIFSSVNIIFSKSKNFYFIEEFRFPMPWMTEIPRDEVISARLTNAKTGPKYFWIILMSLNLILCFTDGFHFLLNPYAFGAGLLVGKFYILTGFVHLLALCILLLKHQTLLEIVTKEKIYEINFNLPAVKNPDLVEAISNCFDLNVTGENESILKQTQIKDWRNLIIGLIFLITAIISVVTFRFAGDPLRIVLYIFGFILVVKGIKEDFSTSKNGFKILKSNENQELIVKKNWLWFKSIYKFNKIDHKFEFRLSKLNFFDILLMIFVPFVVGLDISGVLYFNPWTSPNMIWMNIMHIFGDSLLLIFTLNVIIRPVNVLFLKNQFFNYEYNIPGILSSEQNELLKEKNFVSRFVFKLKYVMSNQGDGFWKRKMGVFIAFLLGIFIMGRKTQVLGIWLSVLIVIVLIIIAYLLREILKKKITRIRSPEVDDH